MQAAKKAINAAFSTVLEAGLRYETALAVSTVGEGKKFAQAAAALQKRK